MGLHFCYAEILKHKLASSSVLSRVSWSYVHHLYHNITIYMLDSICLTVRLISGLVDHLINVLLIQLPSVYYVW